MLNTIFLYMVQQHVRIAASGITIFSFFMSFNVHVDTEHVATNLLISLLCIATYSDRFPILDDI
jgi:hypothetical protein